MKFIKRAFGLLILTLCMESVVAWEVVSGRSTDVHVKGSVGDKEFEYSLKATNVWPQKLLDVRVRLGEVYLKIPSDIYIGIENVDPSSVELSYSGEAFDKSTIVLSIGYGKHKLCKVQNIVYEEKQWLSMSFDLSGKLIHSEHRSSCS